jgi:hypothetical protein
MVGINQTYTHVVCNARVEIVIQYTRGGLKDIIMEGNNCMLGNSQIILRLETQTVAVHGTQRQQGHHGTKD